jgi:hypothetical protein
MASKKAVKSMGYLVSAEHVRAQHEGFNHSILMWSLSVFIYRIRSLYLDLRPIVNTLPTESINNWYVEAISEMIRGRVQIISGVLWRTMVKDFTEEVRP